MEDDDEVSYDRQTVNNPNPIARFAHLSRLKKSMGLVEPFLTEGSTLLDYGCGEGQFLHDLSKTLPSSAVGIRLLGYDPYMSAKHDDYEVVCDEGQIGDETVDVITCLEVCEHLSAEETATLLSFAQRVMKVGGRLLVTVPIMMGPSLLLKEGSRSLLHRRRPDTKAWQLIKASAIGVPPERADDIKSSHRGYDWRVTMATFSEAFTREHVEFSPLPYKKWYGQSQVLMLFRK